MGWLKNSLGPIVSRTLAQWEKHDGSLLAASLSFYASFSIFPLILVLLSILGFVLQFSDRAKQEQQQLLEVVSQTFSPDLAEELGAILGEVQTKAPLSGPIGLAVLLYGAIRIFFQIVSAFDRIWETTPSAGTHSSWLQSVWATLITHLRAFLMLIAIGAMVVIVFASGMVLAALRRYTDDVPLAADAWGLTAWLPGLLFNMLFLTLIYKTLPRGRAPWSSAAIGGGLAALAWEAGRWVLAQFLITGKYSAYGVIGSFIAILLWLYYASSVLFLFAELVHVLTQRRSAKPTSAGNHGPPLASEHRP